MSPHRRTLLNLAIAASMGTLSAPLATAAEQSSLSTPTNGFSGPITSDGEYWNWHAQNTVIVQYHPGFWSKYSGPNSLSSANEVKETVSLDLLFGARLWQD